MTQAADPSIIVLTAPSGAGKTSIARRVMAERPALRFSVSATTRPPRLHEKDGVHYHFVSEEAFRAFIDEGALIEFEEVYPGRFYGTLRNEVARATPQHPVLLDIDVMGALHIKALFGEAALVLFIRPPSLEILADRLERRATETEETLAHRLERAEMEMQQADQCDAVVVNDDLDDAVEETLRHIDRFLQGGRRAEGASTFIP